jgi:hypothetical protein
MDAGLMAAFAGGTVGQMPRQQPGKGIVQLRVTYRCSLFGNPADFVAAKLPQWLYRGMG